MIEKLVNYSRDSTALVEREFNRVVSLKSLRTDLKSALLSALDTGADGFDPAEFRSLLEGSLNRMALPELGALSKAMRPAPSAAGFGEVRDSSQMEALQQAQKAAVESIRRELLASLKRPWRVCASNWRGQPNPGRRICPRFGERAPTTQRVGFCRQRPGAGRVRRHRGLLPETNGCPVTPSPQPTTHNPQSNNLLPATHRARHAHPPHAHTYTCRSAGWSKTVAPRSDALGPGIISRCPVWQWQPGHPACRCAGIHTGGGLANPGQTVAAVMGLLRLKCFIFNSCHHRNSVNGKAFS